MIAIVVSIIGLALVAYAIRTNSVGVLVVGASLLVAVAWANRRGCCDE